MDYKDTLNLPKTEFAMKANLPQREPERIAEWKEKKIYEKLLEKNQNSPKFILHDGPPYANGNIHFGHILNKVIKDITLKYKSSAGFYAKFVPGWDCHGLPIEHQVEKKLKEQLSEIEFRKKCREYAQSFVDIQREEFKRLGIFADWQNPYLTMNYSYEATIARELAKLVKAGLVYKGSKPVHWSTKCQTALAEAEVEYEDHISPSIYVKFKSLDDLGQVDSALKGREVYFIIWTTTPWTLPANVALALNEKFNYVALDMGDEVFIVAEGLLESLRHTLNFQEEKILAHLPTKKLEGLHAQHPFLERNSLVILGDHVTLESGTGIVHTAPGHGQEDYEVGKKYQLPVLNPVDGRGCFTEEVGIDELVGEYVFKANEKIIDILKKQSSLLKVEEIKHSYPHCWRSKTPVIFRSTPQYFISMEAHDLRHKALDAIRRTQWIPSWGRDRIYGMVENRPDWCISRQRAWGVPIMGFQCLACKQSTLDADIIDSIANRFEEEGADAYFKYSAEELLPQDFKCPHCGEKKFEKEKDILDVWFDSGVSYAAVLEKRPDLQFPADLYLEGSDQHRGWFHSSLLTSIGSRHQAPYKAVLTHGFVVDGNGKKYSKSAKNYTPPDKYLQTTGAEILRLWVAAEDYRNDIRISNEILDRLKETYRKIRNTCRFLLGNLYDFDPAQHSVPLEERLEIDRWAISDLQRLIAKITAAYENYEFHIIYHALNHYCTVTLSSFYLDILKDRLYCESPQGKKRRAAQSTLYEIISALLPMMAPVLSFTAEEVYQALPQTQSSDKETKSIFLESFPTTNEQSINEDLEKTFQKIMELRREVLKALEETRRNKVIGHPLDAQVRIRANEEWQRFLQKYEGFWADCWIVSQVVVEYELKEVSYRSEQIAGLEICIVNAEGEKCERCWIRSTTVGDNSEHEKLCQRCHQVLEEIKSS
ncbi:MAG: isoleucine--tRNA ligase [Deltaproteobacteria bacterium]|nr:isoleucine--tRNA ligase [Deltaproteobacteria bacterium]